MRLFALSLAVLLSTGCIDRVAIRPDQLTVISSMGSPTEIGSGYSGNTRVSVVAVPTATVIRADGTTTDIRSPYNAIITNRAGAELDFQHPVQATVKGDAFAIAGSNRPETLVGLSDVRAVEVTQVNGVKTFGLTMVVSLAAAGIMTAMLVGSMSR